MLILSGILTLQRLNKFVILISTELNPIFLVTGNHYSPSIIHFCLFPRFHMFLSSISLMLFTLPPNSFLLIHKSSVLLPKLFWFPSFCYFVFSSFSLIILFSSYSISLLLIVLLRFYGKECTYSVRCVSNHRNRPFSSMLSGSWSAFLPRLWCHIPHLQ